MCGILGSIQDRSFQPGPEVLASLRHRGPDSQGQVGLNCLNKTVWLGHTRLAILDPSLAGHQPIFSQCRRWCLSYNGEIYNHAELRQGLPVRFRGHADSETLVELLAHRGLQKTLSCIDGMFAFAALDCVQHKLYLVRDGFGIKPLYFQNDPGRFYFASEIRALDALNPQPPRLNPHALQTFLSLRYVPSPYHLRQDVQRLPPGHFLCFDIASGHYRSQRYIQPNLARFQGSRQEAVQTYHTLLQTAVQKQMLADVPVGVLLSGGIDSALIAALARDQATDLTGFTVGFGAGHETCEIADAADTAARLGLKHRVITVNAEQLRTTCEQASAAVEEPLATVSILPMWWLAQTARQKVTVVLTGQGCDEPWGGYRRYQLEILRRCLPWPQAFRLFQPIGRIWQTAPVVVRRGLSALPIDNTAIRFVAAYALFNAEERLALTGCSDSGHALSCVQTWLDWLNRPDLSPAERMMRIDTRMNLADDLLLYGDKICMAQALEARVPMLDRDVIALVESLPLSWRIRIRQGKILHKQMAARYLPKAIVHRPKKGFQVPFSEWSRGPWKDWIADWLLEPASPYLTVIDRQAVQRLWQQHLDAKPDRGRQIFALLMLAIWWKQQGLTI